MRSNNNAITQKQDKTFFMIEEYRDLDRQIKALTAQKDVIGKELKSGFFLNHTDFIQDGRLIATYRPTTVIRLNQRLLKAERPEIYEAYQEIVEEKRFLLK